MQNHEPDLMLIGQRFQILSHLVGGNLRIRIRFNRSQVVTLGIFVLFFLLLGITFFNTVRELLLDLFSQGDDKRLLMAAGVIAGIAVYSIVLIIIPGKNLLTELIGRELIVSPVMLKVRTIFGKKEFHISKIQAVLCTAESENGNSNSIYKDVTLLISLRTNQNVVRKKAVLNWQEDDETVVREQCEFLNTALAKMAFPVNSSIG